MGYTHIKNINEFWIIFMIYFMKSLNMITKYLILDSLFQFGFDFFIFFISVDHF